MGRKARPVTLPTTDALEIKMGGLLPRWAVVLLEPLDRSKVKCKWYFHELAPALEVFSTIYCAVSGNTTAGEVTWDQVVCHNSETVISDTKGRPVCRIEKIWHIDRMRIQQTATRKRRRKRTKRAGGRKKKR